MPPPILNIVIVLIFTYLLFELIITKVNVNKKILGVIVLILLITSMVFLKTFLL
jgi:hypothetical protein